MVTRRTALAGVMSAITIAARTSPVRGQAAPKTFVLVHGAWGGGWVWRRVADLLEMRGHKVFAPTMTGLGERSHLLDSKVNLATHVTDVRNVIRWEGLGDIVLVGHSYGGMVITGVAEQIPNAIRSIVFVDADFPQHGQAVVDLAPPSFRDLIRGLEQRGEISLRPQPASASDVNEMDRAWIDSQCTPHPLASLIQPVTETGARERVARKAYVRATNNLHPAHDATYSKYRSIPGWRTYAVACGHYVMVDMPERLTEILLDVA
jgi:pimeloyl-ACP methyl ester carboxylesterase